ncbi:MAG: IS630 family transposase [Cytophagaceae bacterium]|nr:MAG: IS630 family transposase [Cytophagaceae bacterium]
MPIQSQKKRDADAFDRARAIIRSLHQRALAGQCELFYFDESGFSPNPPIQYGWSRIGQVRSVEPQAHRQRVNVLGALRQDGKLVWCTQQRPTVRNDVIAFFDRLSEAPHSSPRIVVIDNAAIHKGEAMDSKRRQWAVQGLYLYYLPPYSPELNRIEILWKQAKYYWRRFCSLKGEELLNEVNSIFNAFGTDFTINFA